MGNAIEKLVQLRKEAVEAEKKVVDGKIKAAYEQHRKNSEEVFRICMETLAEIAKDPYSDSIEENFSCVCGSDIFAQFNYFNDHLYLLPNLKDIYAFGYVYELDKSKRSQLPKIFFDLEYFKELVALNEGLVFEKSNRDNFCLKVEQEVPVVDESCINGLELKI